MGRGGLGGLPAVGKIVQRPIAVRQRVHGRLARPLLSELHFALLSDSADPVRFVRARITKVRRILHRLRIDDFQQTHSRAELVVVQYTSGDLYWNARTSYYGITAMPTIAANGVSDCWPDSWLEADYHRTPESRKSS